ncbi:MAG: radical SAM protein [Candidatus Omnitrophica bacterium]|nr:radical SAM protein [Candidatus Omnitrophota bacterium]MDD5591864.1 radical SAM protein [Candidatus Omnitrophota bacterium]
MAYIKPNSNFYSLAGTSFSEEQSGEYKEYRRCWVEYPTNFIVRDFPMHLDIEITNRCNIKCTFCDKLHLLKNTKLSDMDIDLYKRIIDEGSENRLWAIKLSYRGEPLLHEEIAKMVSYAKKKGILDVYFNTNGVLLTKEKSEEMIGAGLDRISISIDGVDPEIFEKQRIGAKFNTIIKNIDALLDLRRKRGVNFPRIRIQTVYFSDLDLETYKSFWKNRCDEVAAVDYKDSINRKEDLINNWACPQLWQRMTIEWDGTIMPCNNDDLHLLDIGNVKTRSIYDSWHDDRVNQARALHHKGRSHEVKACNGCPWRTAQIKKPIHDKN